MLTLLGKPEGQPTFDGLLRALRDLLEQMQQVSMGIKGQTALDIQKIADISPLQIHDVVTHGLPVILAREMTDAYKVVGREAVLRAIGVSERTLQRGKDTERLLDSNASDRLLRLAAITERAIDVLGSKAAAEQWLVAPALALDQRRPIDLVQSSEGAELVNELLTRMDYGVYA